MVREFHDTTCSKVIFVLDALVTVACFISFLVIDGKELVYSLYIPLDLFLGVCKFGFYHWYLYKDKYEKEDQKQLDESLSGNENTHKEPLIQRENTNKFLKQTTS